MLKKASLKVGDAMKHDLKQICIQFKKKNRYKHSTKERVVVRDQK